MPYHKTPPKNYRMAEFPLHHDFSGGFFLAGENAALDSTIVSLARSRDDVSINADAVEVNPKHNLFAEETGSTCQAESIVPRMSFGFNARIPTSARLNQWVGGGGVEALEELIFNWMPIYTAFKEPLEAVNEEDALAVEAVLELNVANGNSVRPLYTGTDLIGATTGDIPVSTINDVEVFGDLGLSVDFKQEAVDFDPDIFFDAMKYGSTGSIIKKITGKWNTVRLRGGHAYHFHSENYMFPSVKRMNPFTFCGILFHLPQAADPRQLFDTGDTTATIAQLRIDYVCNYDEWNPNYDQTAA